MPELNNITIPTPETTTQRNPVSMRLTAEQVGSLASSLTAGGITLPPGISQIVINVARDQSAVVRLSFFPS